MKIIVFYDPSSEDIEDRLPFVGKTVAFAKSYLQDLFAIPYFSDAIVNGEVVPVQYALQPDDRLQFQKRFGSKGNKDRTFEEREAQGLIDSYGLDKIAADVKRLDLPKDESIDVMRKMVEHWALQRFGHIDATSWKILNEIVRRIKSIEDCLGPANQNSQTNQAEACILEALGDNRLTGIQLAKKAGYPCNSNFRQTLSSMVKRGLLINDHPGYRIAKSGLCQDWPTSYPRLGFSQGIGDDCR